MIEIDITEIRDSLVIIWLIYLAVNAALISVITNR
jgi:hypothetical protein